MTTSPASEAASHQLKMTSIYLKRSNGLLSIDYRTYGCQISDKMYTYIYVYIYLEREKRAMIILFGLGHLFKSLCRCLCY